MPDLPALTDEQRQQIRAFFEQNPDGGYKSACRAAGLVRLTKQQARQLIDDDDELGEVREKALGVDEDSAWRRVARIAAAVEHKDALRANTFILGAIHGRSEKQAVEVSGPGGGPVVTEDRSASLRDVAKVLVDVGALRSVAKAADG